MTRDLRIQADGYQLAARIHEAPEARAVVLLNPAMGVPLTLYDDFADWLSDENYHVIAWNYRGTGNSGDPLTNNVHIHDWGETDLDAMLAWCERSWPELPRIVVAHSVGGQIIGMAKRSKELAAIITIASQSGYWRLFTGWQRWRIAFFWFLFIPLVCRVTKVFPGRTLGLAAEDLPAKATRQWARWGRDPDYHHGRHRRESVAGFRDIACPFLSIWIADDDLASHAANRAMLSWYPSTRTTTIDLHPAKEGLDRIGHFGFFRAERGRERLWPKISDWLAGVIG